LFRAAQKGEDLGEWHLCLEKTHRRWFHLFFNPEGARLLACGSAVQQLLADLNEIDDANPASVENTVSYQLIRDLVDYQTRRLCPSGQAIAFQFKLRVKHQSENTVDEDDVLISPIYGGP
jgi:hypothetical protein